MSRIKLKSLVQKEEVQLDEKKQAIASSGATNITLHFDDGFKEVGEDGTPEMSFTISMSSVGGKEYFRGVGDREEAQKMLEAIKLELRRTMRKFDKRVGYIVEKYKLQSR
jgi:hypothetical protein